MRKEHFLNLLLVLCLTLAACGNIPPLTNNNAPTATAVPTLDVVSFPFYAKGTYFVGVSVPSYSETGTTINFTGGESYSISPGEAKVFVFEVKMSAITATISGNWYDTAGDNVSKICNVWDIMSVSGYTTINIIGVNIPPPTVTCATPTP